MKNKKTKGKGMFALTCILTFIISFLGSAVFKITYKPAWSKKYTVEWSDFIGTV